MATNFEENDPLVFVSASQTVPLNYTVQLRRPTPIINQTQSIPIPLPVSMGGTGATTPEQAKTNLDVSFNTGTVSQGQVLPPGNNGDILVYNAYTKQWEARSVYTGGGSINEDGTQDTSPGGSSLDLYGGTF